MHHDEEAAWERVARVVVQQGEEVRATGVDNGVG